MLIVGHIACRELVAHEQTIRLLFCRIIRPNTTRLFYLFGNGSNAQWVFDPALTTQDQLFVCSLIRHSDAWQTSYYGLVTWLTPVKIPRHGKGCSQYAPHTYYSNSPHKALKFVFTARCTIVQSAVLRSYVVCLSVCNFSGSWPHRLKTLETNCANN